MNIKKSIVIKELNGIEVLREEKNSIKDAVEYCKKERENLSKEQKRGIKFRIVEKIIYATK